MTNAQVSASTTLAAALAPCACADGRELKAKIATGSVGSSGLARKLVAPNSPREIAKAKPAPTPLTRAKMGSSTVTKDCRRLAPKVAAASRRCGLMARKVGRTERSTSGTATTACAAAKNAALAGKESGGACKVINIPKPTVTALTP